MIGVKKKTVFFYSEKNTFVVVVEKFYVCIFIYLYDIYHMTLLCTEANGR
jgi:hypothetical protein